MHKFFKREINVFPSANQIKSGLEAFFFKTLKKELADESKRYLLRHLKFYYARVFAAVFDSMEFSDIDRPFEETDDEEYGLNNPGSKAVCLVMWLYSIEPPFYAYVNKAFRD